LETGSHLILWHLGNTLLLTTGKQVDLCGFASFTNSRRIHGFLFGSSRITLTENKGPIRYQSLKYSKFDLWKFGGT